MDIQVLVLDFDGVLASHGELEPCEETIHWLKTFSKKWSPSNIVILSNKPLLERAEFFEAHFPEIEFILNAEPKPYPHGLELIAKKKEVSISQVALVDDRWLTGMLAAAIAGAQGIYIKRPYQNYQKRPFKELFFSVLRSLERGALLILSKHPFQ